MRLVKRWATLLPTPLGMMYAVSVESTQGEAIERLKYVALEPLGLEMGSVQWMSAWQRSGELARLARQLEDYFSGSRQYFELALAIAGTDFQQKAWQSLQRIPYAVTYSYQKQAVAVEKPSAVRAVANANRLNPWSIIVPCHRVIGRNGGLTGYAGGLWRKQWLLDFEKAHAGF